MSQQNQQLIESTPSEQVDAAVQAAAAGARPWGRLGPAERARVLDQVADALDADRDALLPIGMQETNLPEGRLTGELKRTTFQLRLFGEVLRAGDWLDVRIDYADPDWPMGAPRPDLRRIKTPLGPVVVFAASNFPFAFSVAGGDTASALAAGCPVIVKAHPGHPELSRRTADVVTGALAEAGAPAGVFSLVQGQEAGVRVLQDPAIAAGAFTGSISGGRALFDIAASRPTPIPFFGELGSNNPAFVTEQAAADLRDSVISGFIGSFTLGAGQFCTKPGMLVVPRSSGLAEAVGAAELPGPAPMLNERILAGYRSSLAELRAREGVGELAGAADESGDGAVAPTLLRADIRTVIDDPRLQEECFGPTALVVEYDDPRELVELADSLEGQLTATIWGTDDSDVTELVEVLADRAGRLLWNQWPTGVSVTYAQQHGGPYPATTAPSSTSVGTAAIERFLRPVAFQGFPQRLLPAALRDDNPLDVPQRVDS